MRHDHWHPSRQASRDALRAWSGWASTVIHGQRHELEHLQHYELNRGLGLCYEQDLLLRHSATGPSGQPTADNDNMDGHGWSLRLRAPGAGNRSHEPITALPGTGLGRPEPTRSWTEQPVPRHPTGPARARSPWLGTRQKQGE